VRPEVDGGCGPGQAPGRGLDGRGLAGQGEHRTMVVGIPVNVEQNVPYCRPYPVEVGPVSPLAHVDDAFEQVRVMLAIHHSCGNVDPVMRLPLRLGECPPARRPIARSSLTIMLLGNIAGVDGIYVLIILLVVVFGGSQLPKIAKNLGGAGREFKKAQREAAEEEEAESRRKAAAAPPAVAAAPVVPPAPPVQPTAVPVTPVQAEVPANDNITISRSELERMLDEKLKGQQHTS
jgi:TatA/E family protein of Tat protein translocase